LHTQTGQDEKAPGPGPGKEGERRDNNDPPCQQQQHARKFHQEFLACLNASIMQREKKELSGEELSGRDGKELQVMPSSCVK
jgi:hypothetical protein